MSSLDVPLLQRSPQEEWIMFDRGLTGKSPAQRRSSIIAFLKNAIAQYKQERSEFRREMCCAILFVGLGTLVLLLSCCGLAKREKLRQRRIVIENAIKAYRDDLKGVKLRLRW